MRPGILLLCVAIHVACGSDDDDGDVGGADGGGNPQCETAEGTVAASGIVKIGGVTDILGPRAAVEGVLVEGTDWQFFDMSPQLQIESARAGDCILYEWEPTFCDPECIEGICNDGECKPFPATTSAGTLRIVAGGQLIEVNPEAPGFWGSVYRQEILAAPMAGAEVAFCAGGEAAGGFGAILEAVPPLLGALPEDGVLELTDGDDLVVSWNAPSDARVRLTLNADNQFHGQPYRAVLECDAEDSGQLVIAQELIEAFPPVSRPADLPPICGGTDCPRSELIRYRAHRVDQPDLRVEVRVESALQFWIEH
jgi:hypothetical protein